MSLSSRTLVRDTARLLGANTLTRSIGILALVAYARMLSPADLAALPVFLFLGAFTTIPFNLGLYPTLMREVPRLLLGNDEEALGVIRTVVCTVGGGVPVAGVAYLAFAPAIAKTYFGTASSAWLVRWMVAGTVARGWDEVVTFGLRAP